MKILFFLPSYTLTIERGDTRHIKELVSNLSKLAELDVIKADGAIASERLHLMVVALRAMQGFIKAAFSIRRRRPDLIYTRNSEAIFTFFLGKLFRLPFIIEVNGLFIDEWRMETGPSGMRRWLTYIKGLVNERTYRYANHLIVVTSEIKKMLEGEYKINPEKISVIENGANTELFRPMNTKEARNELKLSDTYDYICFSGTLYKWQGVEYLIRASPYILEECPKTLFLIIGDGPTRKLLTTLTEQLEVSDKFIFTGAVPYEKVPLYINASDVCVVPKRPMRSGYSPLKLYEYMASGKPVVATRTNGFEILEENRTGLLVNPEDPRELANAIVGLLRDPKIRKSMGESGRRHVVENRSWESVAGKIFEVCQTVA